MKKGKYEYNEKTLTNFQATAYCDRTGFRVMHKDLRKQYEWAGDKLVFTGLMVHKDFLDEPQPFFKYIQPKTDPTPVENPRPGFFDKIPSERTLAPDQAEEFLMQTQWNFNRNPFE